MKKRYTLLLLFFIISLSIFAQKNIDIHDNGNYYLNPSIGWDNFTFTALNNKKILKGKDYILRVKDVLDNQVFFQFWKFRGNEELNKQLNGENNDVIYELPIDKFKKLVNVYYNRVDWRAGAYTVPVKLRFDDFDFTSNINIGSNIGAKIRWNRKQENGFSIEPVFGLGISGISLDDFNSDVYKSTNSIAFSMNTGIIFHITDRINLGILYGFDKLSDKDQYKYNWKHNGKGWLGLGINVSFSNDNNNNSTSGKNP